MKLCEMFIGPGCSRPVLQRDTLPNVDSTPFVLGQLCKRVSRYVSIVRRHALDRDREGCRRAQRSIPTTRAKFQFDARCTGLAQQCRFHVPRDLLMEVFMSVSVRTGNKGNAKFVAKHRAVQDNADLTGILIGFEGNSTGLEPETTWTDLGRVEFARLAAAQVAPLFELRRNRRADLLTLGRPAPEMITQQQR